MDRREEILARLAAIAAGIDGVKTAARNKDEFSDLARPAVVLIDGDEEAHDSDPPTRPTTAPRLVALKPEIVILLSGAPESVGSSLNALRTALIKAILTDAILIGIVHDRIGTRYIGCVINIGRGRAVEGELRLHFVFTYALRAEEL